MVDKDGIRQFLVMKEIPNKDGHLWALRKKWKS